jgi:tetratricopeptide (TPR) repeat protein
MMPAISVLVFLTVVTQTQGIDAFREGRFQDARVELEKSVAAHPDDTTARAFLAMTKAAQKDCLDAVNEFQRGGDDQLARLSGIAAVECLSATDRAGGASSLISAVLARFPSDPDVLYESAKIHRKAWDAAVLGLYQKAPASFRVNQISAEVFESEGKYGEAAAQYEKAIEKASSALNLHYRLGRCLLLASPSPENLDKARKQFEAELKLNPSDAVAKYQVAQILTAQQKPEEARKWFEEALALKPDFAEAMIAVGRSRASDKHYAEAAQLFERAAALQPENEAAHYNLMLAYRDLGRGADAMEQKKILDKLQKPPEGEFTEFLKKIGEKAPEQ